MSTVSECPCMLQAVTAVMLTTIQVISKNTKEVVIRCGIFWVAGKRGNGSRVRLKTRRAVVSPDKSWRKRARVGGVRQGRISDCREGFVRERGRCGCSK